MILLSRIVWCCRCRNLGGTGYDEVAWGWCCCERLSRSRSGQADIPPAHTCPSTSHQHFDTTEIYTGYLHPAEERNRFYVAFNSLIYRDEIEIQNREGIPFSLGIVPKGLAVPEAS